MHIYFESPEFDSQLLRTLGYTYYQGADIGECLTTALHIKPKDFESWFTEWNATGERILNIGNHSLENHAFESAKLSFLRASNYFRTAMFFLYGSPVDPRLIEAYDKHCEAFDQAVKLFAHPVEEIQIPYQETFLSGYFYKCTSSQDKKPVVIISNGYDSTHQECYLMAGAAALSRGYHVLCFDGPGQGSALIKQQLYMRPDWENVITPVIDFLLARQDIHKKKIALIGPSWGGYLAPRAAAFEHRLAALVANPGQMDALIPIKKLFPDIVELIQENATSQMNQYLVQAFSNPMFAAKMKAKMWVHNVDSPAELIKQWANYNLEGISTKITCPTLVLDSENEAFSKGQAKILYDSLTCPKDYHLFTAKDGAGEHCEAGASSLANQFLFDWLQQHLNS